MSNCYIMNLLPLSVQTTLINFLTLDSFYISMKCFIMEGINGLFFLKKNQHEVVTFSISGELLVKEPLVAPWWLRW